LNIFILEKKFLCEKILWHNILLRFSFFQKEVNCFQMSRVPSPTQTEWNTFQVMANPAFVNIRTTKPNFHEEAQDAEESRAPSPVQSEILDSISVVAEKQASAK
jgi:hypothetical protein